jgi:hypothetical protein
MSFVRRKGIRKMNKGGSSIGEGVGLPPMAGEAHASENSSSIRYFIASTIAIPC